MTTRRKLTPEESADAQRLNTAWLAYKAENKGANQTWLAAEAGLGTQGAVGQYLRGYIPLNLEALLALCRVIGTDPAKISPRLAASLYALPVAAKPHFVEQAGNVYAGPENRGDVPVISWVQAGTWCDAADPLPPGSAEEWLPCPVRHSSHTFALRVRGVSMENPSGKYSYSDGDIIYVDPQKHADNGARVIVRMDEQKEATFKQLVIEGDRKYLKALNPAWPEQIIEINGNATICGVVIGKWVPE